MLEIQDSAGCPGRLASPHKRQGPHHVRWSVWNEGKHDRMVELAMTGMRRPGCHQLLQDVLSADRQGAVVQALYIAEVAHTVLAEAALEAGAGSQLQSLTRWAVMVLTRQLV